MGVVIHPPGATGGYTGGPCGGCRLCPARHAAGYAAAESRELDAAVPMAFGTFVSLQPRTIGPGAPVIFDTVLSAPPAGISFSPGSATVTVMRAGIYHVTYSVRAAAETGGMAFLLVNGEPLPNSGICASPAFARCDGCATINLTADSTLGIGTAGAAVTLAFGNNAFLDVFKMA